MQFGLELRACLGDLSEEFFVFGQQMIDVTGAGVGVVRILDVEVVAVGLDLLDRDAPGLFVFLALAVEPVLVRLAPPLAFGLELFDADWLPLVVAFGTRGIGMLVVPDLLRRRALGEEEQIGADAGVGTKDAVGEPDDRMQIAIGQERFLDPGFHAFAEERPIGQHQASAAAGFEDPHQQDEKQIGRFAGAELGGIVRLDAVFFHAAEGGIGDDDIDAFLGPPILEWAGERVVVPDVGRDVNAVQQQVRHAKDVR